MKKMTLAAAVLLLATAGLAGCADKTPGTAAPASASAEAGQSLAFSGGWAKAAETGGMTSAFGTLKNNGPEDLTIVAARSAAAGDVELHETATGADGTMTMREIDGGFVVPAGGEFQLEPGGTHLMLMELTRDLLAGDELAITLELGDGSTTDIQATAKDFAGANENYGDAAAEGHGTGDEHAAVDH